MKKKVYIDGQNFLYKAAEILIRVGEISSKDELTKLNIRGIIENIVGIGVEIVYYGAKVNVRKDLGEGIEEKTRRFSDVSRRIRNTLNQQNISFIESGKLKVRDSDMCHNCNHKDLRLQEKGVDVGIAVDMVTDALLKRVNEVVLVSSDTDLLPAIDIVTGAKVAVTYIGFSNKTTNAIVAKTSRTEIIRDQEVLDAYNAVKPPA